MDIKQYFKQTVKNRSDEKGLYSKVENELALREVDTLFFLLKEFFNFFESNENKTVLDIGCGNKYLQKPFQDRNYVYEGYDIEDLDIEKDKIPKEDNSVDLVVAVGLIEALSDVTNLIKESKRVLKKNGYLYLITPNWLKDYKNFYNNPIHKTPFTPTSMEVLLNSFNYSDVKIFPGLRCKSKWFYEGKLRFEKAYFLFPFLKYVKKNNVLSKRRFIPEFLQGHARSIIAVARK